MRMVCRDGYRPGRRQQVGLHGARSTAGSLRPSPAARCSPCGRRPGRLSSFSSLRPWQWGALDRLAGTDELLELVLAGVTAVFGERHTEGSILVQRFRRNAHRSVLDRRMLTRETPAWRRPRPR